MKVVGYYGNTYWVSDEVPIESIDLHLKRLRQQFPKLPNHPDIDRLLDLRSELLKERTNHDD